jgi:hypothetical protein
MEDRIEYNHLILDLLSSILDLPSFARRGVFSHRFGMLILTP